MDRQGRTVRVRRRWLPWRRRVRDIDAPDLDLGGGDDPISMILTVVGLVLAIPFVLALVLLVGELVLLVLLLPLTLLVRVLFKRPWTVEATSGRRLLWSEQVRGWTESGVRVLEVAAIYERGDEPRDGGAAGGGGAGGGLSPGPLGKHHSPEGIPSGE